jgi:hypothetical protein
MTISPINLLSTQVPANSTAIYTAALAETPIGPPIPPYSLFSLTLTTFDTLTGTIINNVNKTNILNTDRGMVEQVTIGGTTITQLTVDLNTGDTDMSEVPGSLQVQRSLLFNFSWNGGTNQSWHRCDFIVVQEGPI